MGIGTIQYHPERMGKYVKKHQWWWYITVTIERCVFFSKKKTLANQKLMDLLNRLKKGLKLSDHFRFLKKNSIENKRNYICMYMHRICEKYRYKSHVFFAFLYYIMLAHGHVINLYISVLA